MTTGAPIYLVSACTSGEEFVLAFRRYTDRTGVFVPIHEPLPAGRKGRFALTLKDGGVMIEGEAEVVSSAKTASVLHGRIGMTIRFVAPDDASKTVLSELEKARLAMKPQPPSIPPRPATIPDEPRPVPPAPLGRVDAVNALAECVAIGDATAIAGDAAAASPPPKASQKFVVPSIPNVGGTRPASASTPPMGMPRPAPTPPAVDLLTTQRGQAPGPSAGDAPSGRPRIPTPFGPMPVVARGPSPTSPPPLGPPRAPMPAMPMPIVQPRAQPPSVPPPVSPPIAPTPVLPLPVVQPPIVAAPRPALPEIEVNEPTDLTVIPQPDAAAPETVEEELAVTARSSDGDSAKLKQKRETRRTVMGVAVVPSGVTVLPAAPAVRIPADDESRDTTEMAAEEHTSGGTPLRDLLAAPAASAARTTAPGAAVPPKASTPNVEEPTPSGDWTMTPGADGPTIVPTRTAQAAAAAAPPKRSEPRLTGDWMIALDPSRPDGWSEPSKIEKRPPGELPPGPPVSAVSSDKPLDSARANQPEPAAPSTEPKVQIDPTLIEPLQPLPDDDAPLAGPPTSQFATPPYGSTTSQQLPVAMADGHAPASFASPGPEVGYAIPTPMPGMLPPPPAPPSSSSSMRMHPGSVPVFPAATGSNTAYPSQAPAFPIDPQAMLQTHRVRAPTAAEVRGDGVTAPPADPTSLVQGARRRRLIVIIASAALVVLAGIVLLIVIGRSGHGSGSGTPAPSTSTAPATTPAAGSDQVAMTGPGSAAVAAPADGAVAIAPVTPDAARVESATPPVATECVLDVITSPAGAEVYLEGNQVIGPAPTKVTLPCGVAAKISARKKAYASTTRVVTPTADAKPVKLVLGKVTFSVKVSSTPAGATILLGARSLGVTPTNIRLNAFEAATLTIKKDGYATETQKITPKQNNQTVHAALKKTAIKRGR